MLRQQNKNDHQKSKDKGSNKRGDDKLIEFFYHGLRCDSSSKITPKIGKETEVNEGV